MKSYQKNSEIQTTFLFSLFYFYFMFNILGNCIKLRLQGILCVLLTLYHTLLNIKYYKSNNCHTVFISVLEHLLHEGVFRKPS